MILYSQVGFLELTDKINKWGISRKVIDLNIIYINHVKKIVRMEFFLVCIFGLNAEFYSVNLRIQAEHGKMRTSG